MNNQPREPLTNSDPNVLDVHSIFHTIQGEGPFTGHPAVFVRLAGCNLQCANCDTNYTTGRRMMTIDEIVQPIFESESRLVVISGGEPFRQNFSGLVEVLQKQGYTVQIESNGTICPDWVGYFADDHHPNRNLHFVICPKTAQIHRGWLQVDPSIVSYKYVMNAEHVSDADGLPLSVLGQNVRPFRPAKSDRIYLQPEDNLDTAINGLNVDACIASCLKFNYILCLQVHKIVQLP
jgi:organic radical activating enzyme